MWFRALGLRIHRLGVGCLSFRALGLRIHRLGFWYLGSAFAGFAILLPVKRFSFGFGMGAGLVLLSPGFGF